MLWNARVKTWKEGKYTEHTARGEHHRPRFETYPAAGELNICALKDQEGLRVVTVDLNKGCGRRNIKKERESEKMAVET